MPLSSLPRPEVVVQGDGSLTNPDGWAKVQVSADGETVVAAWTDDDAQTFHQWEPTEAIVKQLMNALAAYQQAWGADVSGHRGGTA